MKIFMVHEDPWHAGNPYIYTLIESLASRYEDIQIGWGREAFWDNEIFSYDIVHFHWPQTFMAGDSYGHTIDDLRSRIEMLKKYGIFIVATCHDLKPHYGQCADFGLALTVVYDSCDAVFHLGEYSLSLFRKQYSKAKHYLMCHHVYDTVYEACLPDKNESCQRLKLSPRRKYVLCLGAFRSQEERNLVKYVAIHTSRKVHYLAPSFFQIPPFRKRHPWGYIKALFVRQYLFLVYRIHCTGKSWVPVPDGDIKYYFGACDFAFVHRLKILNSGNAVLPLLFGKRVVGPDIGNVGFFLRHINMPVFNVADKRTAAEKIMLELDASSPSEDDIIKRFVENNLQTNIVADRLYSYYKEIISDVK